MKGILELRKRGNFEAEILDDATERRKWEEMPYPTRTYYPLRDNRA